MAKQGVVPDELTKPFWEAANEGRLVIQNCKACNRLQHPPAPACSQCGSRDDLGMERDERAGQDLQLRGSVRLPNQTASGGSTVQLGGDNAGRGPGNPDVLPPARNLRWMRFQ